MENAPPSKGWRNAWSPDLVIGLFVNRYEFGRVI
jgi:hypothetical protein